MGEENEVKKATHMDEFLKQLVVEKYKLAIDLSIKGSYGSCFRAYRALFYMIQPYEFEMKQTLTELTETITDFINSLDGNPIDERSFIKFKNKETMFKDLINIYMSQIPKAFVELGLWFKVVNYHNDIEKQLSEENFNSDLSTLARKKKELLKLSSDQLISLMKPTHVHDCFSKLRIENAI